MPEQPIDWDNYQVSVDPSVPNPVASPTSNGHGHNAGPGGIGLRPDLRLVPLGGGYRTSRRRVVSLVIGVLAAMVVAVGLVLPWAIVRGPQEGATRLVPYWEDYPNACTVVVAVAVASLALLCAHRARYLVTLLNLMAALVIVFSTAQTQSTNATLGASALPQTLHLLGFSWLILFAGVVLNVVASVVQPPPP